MFHKQIPVPPLNTVQATIKGNPPNCPKTTNFWIISEILDPNDPINNYSQSVNDFVPVILDEYMTGNITGAWEDFSQVTSWWTGIGFMDQAAREAGQFSTRDLAYFLFCQRATNFSFRYRLTGRGSVMG